MLADFCCVMFCDSVIHALLACLRGEKVAAPILGPGGQQRAIGFRQSGCRPLNLKTVYPSAEELLYPCGRPASSPSIGDRRDGPATPCALVFPRHERKELPRLPRQNWQRREVYSSGVVLNVPDKGRTCSLELPGGSKTTRKKTVWCKSARKSVVFFFSFAGTRNLDERC